MLLEFHEVQGPDAVPPQLRNQKQKPEHKTEIADAIDNEGLVSGDRVGVIVVPKTDEEIGTETHAFPADEQHQQIVPHHQQEHKEDKQVQINEKTNHPLVVPHIAERIDMDQEPDAGDDEQHHRGQGIDLKRELDLK